MNREIEILQVMVEQGILPLYFHDDPDVSVRFLESLRKAGIRTVEYADRGPAALRNFEVMRAYCEKELPDLFLGIGTVKSEETARRYIDAGTDFIVCPGLVEETAAITHEAGIPWIPGCLTPSEIIRAEALGAKLVKLYPLNTMGPAYYGAITAVFPDLLFMPTGGIDVDDKTVTEWISAGIGALGGSKLLTPAILGQEQHDLLIENTTHVLELIRIVRNRSGRHTTESLVEKLHALAGRVVS